MTELDFESDAFLSLLTDALRAGPGSPAWHDALRRLRAGGVQHADEYRLLVTAREHLASGREYRSIRAGPGFAKRLMSAIDEEATRTPRTPSTTTTIALASAGAMLAVLMVIGYLLWHASENPAPTDRAGLLLLNNVASIGGDGPIPPDWQPIGKLGVAFDRGGVKIGRGGDESPTGGGAYWQTPIDPAEPFAVVANLRVFHADDSMIPQVFITDDPEFDPNNGTTSREIVWLLRSEQGRLILPSGRVEAQSVVTPATRNVTIIEITITRDQAIVEMGGKRLWNGAHGMDTDKPRYVGVRFLQVGKTNADGAVFESVRINTRQK